MEWLSGVHVNGQDYDLYAVSAASAGSVPATGIDGKIAENTFSSVPETAITSINTSALTAAIPQTAISAVPWSAVSGLTADSASSATSGIWTPSTTREYVTDYVGNKIANVYKFQGTCQVEDLPPSQTITANPENGDVWDLSNGGTINSSSTTHSAIVYKGDNVAWITADGGYWDRLAESITITGKLDTTSFTAWSANTNNDSTFAGTATYASTAEYATKLSGTTSTANAQDIIDGSTAGSGAAKWIDEFTGSGIDTSYLSGDGSNSAKLGLRTPESSIVTGSTESSALVNAGAVSSFVDNNYIAKTDIYINSTDDHQLVINNL